MDIKPEFFSTHRDIKPENFNTYRDIKAENFDTYRDIKTENFNTYSTINQPKSKDYTPLKGTNTDQKNLYKNDPTTPYSNKNYYDIKYEPCIKFDDDYSKPNNIRYESPIKYDNNIKPTYSQTYNQTYNSRTEEIKPTLTHSYKFNEEELKKSYQPNYIYSKEDLKPSFATSMFVKDIIETNDRYKNGNNVSKYVPLDLKNLANQMYKPDPICPRKYHSYLDSQSYNIKNIGEYPNYEQKS